MNHSGRSITQTDDENGARSTVDRNANIGEDFKDEKKMNLIL